jgi:large subunit ribosomal protein L25
LLGRKAKIDIGVYIAMSNIKLVVELRQDCGKGASRRLRRLDNQVPGIIYGGEKEPLSIQLPHNKVIKALENEHFYSSVLTLEVNGSQKEHVILKDLQRHPYKAIIMHMDFQRVSADDEITKVIPLHFLNEEKAPGIIEGGMVNHHMNHIEIRCKVKNLPDHLDVDISKLANNQVLHLSDLKLPKGVELTVDCKEEDHNLAVVSIHKSRVAEDVAAEAKVPADAVPASKESNAE